MLKGHDLLGTAAVQLTSTTVTGFVGWQLRWDTECQTEGKAPLNVAYIKVFGKVGRTPFVYKHP